MPNVKGAVPLSDLTQEIPELWPEAGVNRSRFTLFEQRTGDRETTVSHMGGSAYSQRAVDDLVVRFRKALAGWDNGLADAVYAVIPWSEYGEPEPPYSHWQEETARIRDWIAATRVDEALSWDVTEIAAAYVVQAMEDQGGAGRLADAAATLIWGDVVTDENRRNIWLYAAANGYSQEDAPLDLAHDYASDRWESTTFVDDYGNFDIAAHIAVDNSGPNLELVLHLSTAAAFDENGEYAGRGETLCYAETLADFMARLRDAKPQCPDISFEFDEYNTAYVSGISLVAYYLGGVPDRMKTF